MSIMTKEQYKRANSAVFPIIIIIYGYIAISMILWAPPQVLGRMRCRYCLRRWHI